MFLRIYFAILFFLSVSCINLYAESDKSPYLNGFMHIHSMLTNNNIDFAVLGGSQLTYVEAVAILKLLDRGSDITSEVSAEINDDVTVRDKVAAQKFKQNRHPPLNFREMGILVGSRLLFAKNEQNIEVEVYTDKKVLFNNQERSLTSVTQELLGLDYSVQPTPYWTYNGKSLSDIYNETYSNEDE